MYSNEYARRKRMTKFKIRKSLKYYMAKKIRNDLYKNGIFEEKDKERFHKKNGALKLVSYGWNYEELMDMAVYVGFDVNQIDSSNIYEFKHNLIEKMNDFIFLKNKS